MLEIAIIFIIGLFAGSFLNVLVDRLPKEESVVKGRSHCDKCKKTLGWYDLIPLLSFLLLKGRCRYCQTSLSFYYPIIEFTTGVLFVITTLFVFNGSQFLISNFKFLINLQLLNYQLLITLAYHLFIVSSLIVIFFSDLKYGIIPDRIILPSIVISFLYLFIIHNSLFLIHFLAAVGALLFFLLLFFVTRGRGMGFGDVKFSFLMGLVLGFPKVVIALYIAFLTGAIVGCILIVWRKKKLFGATIPFGPFLVLGTLSVLFWGEILLQKITLALRL